jgi:hypothetical protein
LLNGPFYLQMAAGWTGLLVRINVALVLVYSPIIYLLSLHFAARGAAAAWLILNIIYIAVVVPLVHRKLLRGEMYRWFVHDIGLPLLAAVTALTVLRALMPEGLHAVLLLVFLAVTLLITLSAAALAASHVRAELFSRLSWRMAWLG